MALTSHFPCQRFNLLICFTFIDYEKSFDSIYISSAVKSLEYIGIYNSGFNIIKNIYYSNDPFEKQKTKIKLKKRITQAHPLKKTFLNSRKFYWYSAASIFPWNHEYTFFAPLQDLKYPSIEESWKKTTATNDEFESAISALQGEYYGTTVVQQ